MGAFDTTLGCGCVGANAIDVELIQGAAELRMPVTTNGSLGVDAENAGLVAVERQWLAKVIDVLTRGLEIRKR